MSRKKRFIENLSSEEILTLEEGLKTGSAPDYRKRCHAILLSHKGYSVSEISEILSCTSHSIYIWFKKWESEGISGLSRKAGQGRPKKLLVSDPHHLAVVKKAVEAHAQSLDQILLAVKEALGIEDISPRSLRRFLKKLVTDGNVSEKA